MEGAGPQAVTFTGQAARLGCGRRAFFLRIATGGCIGAVAAVARTGPANPANPAGVAAGRSILVTVAFPVTGGAIGAGVAGTRKFTSTRAVTIRPAGGRAGTLVIGVIAGSYVAAVAFEAGLITANARGRLA